LCAAAFLNGHDHLLLKR